MWEAGDVSTPGLGGDSPVPNARGMVVPRGPPARARFGVSPVSQHPSCPQLLAGWNWCGYWC